MRKIFQLVLAVAILSLVYVIYVLISTPIQFENDKAKIEAAVVDRIKDIRLAERAYKSKYQTFTGNFDSLIHFVLYDSLTMERKIVDEDDSVAMANLKAQGLKNIETFQVAVIDTVFYPKSLTKAQIEELRFIPGTNKQTEYILDAGRITTESKIVIPVVECKAPYIYYLDTMAYRQEIINLIDNDVNNYNKYPGVKFGSMEGGNNEAGNWE
ncbi:MAG: hypothetical protein R3Y39_04360 [Rikenellaceae bacterium]